jgi:hypothetical protein
VLCYNLTVLNDNMVDVLQHVSNCEHDVVSLHLNFLKKMENGLFGGGGGINDTCIRTPWATPGTRTSQTDDPSTARVAFKSTVQSLET